MPPALIGAARVRTLITGFTVRGTFVAGALYNLSDVDFRLVANKASHLQDRCVTSGTLRDHFCDSGPTKSQLTGALVWWQETLVLA